jgi:hypothetical protein
MDEERTEFDPEQEDNCSDDTVERTGKTIRLIGRIIIGALAAALAAEALSFRKKE